MKNSVKDKQLKTVNTLLHFLSFKDRFVCYFSSQISYLFTGCTCHDFFTSGHGKNAGLFLMNTDMFLKFQNLYMKQSSPMYRDWLWVNIGTHTAVFNGPGRQSLCFVCQIIYSSCQMSLSCCWTQNTITEGIYTVHACTCLKRLKVKRLSGR